jgi:hypothetical protein
MMERVLAGRPAPRFIGFGLQPPGWIRPFHIPMRPLAQNSAAAIAAALQRFLADYDEVDLYDGTCRTKVSAIWPLGAFGGGGGVIPIEGKALHIF